MKNAYLVAMRMIGFKQIFSILLLILGTIFLGQVSFSKVIAGPTAPVVCTDWMQVNDNAFGLGTGLDNSYISEDAFEVIVFNDHLYLGMEADNSMGARLWRSKDGVDAPYSQEDWEEVIADSEGRPFGYSDTIQIDHIDSLAEFNGYIYASTANRTGYPLGINIFRSSTGDPGTWEQAITSHSAGFDDINNENFKDMQVFMGYLCGGTTNSENGAEVWCTQDGTNWQKFSYGGFGKGIDDPNTYSISSGYVFNDTLYFGVRNRGTNRDSESDDIGMLYRSSNLDLRDDTGVPTWNNIFSGQPGSHRVNILGEINGYLYITVRSGEGIIILRSNTGEPGSWSPVNTPGMDNDSDNEATTVDGATKYNGTLYVTIANSQDGIEIWRTSGITRDDGNPVQWTLVSDNGINDPNNIYAQLISFNGKLYAWTSNYITGQQVISTDCPTAKYIILLIGDGMGANHIEATRKYLSEELSFQSWQGYWMSTYPIDGSYDPGQAWDDFYYVTQNTTDSAAAATAMFTGIKTANRRISVSADGQTRLYSLTDKARSLGKAVGVVTSVYGSHATPGAWYAHNDDRSNGYAIADEGLWGDPNTTGDYTQNAAYDGGHGNSLPPVDVFIGSGHPSWDGGDYINFPILEKLVEENSDSGDSIFTEQIAGLEEAGEILIQSASDPQISRLIALYGGSEGHIDYQLADGSGKNPEIPSLAEMTKAALQVLTRDTDGFVLLVEGGAIDWASHANNMDQMIGEMVDFNNAVQVVKEWVSSSDNESSWNNTLVIVTGDHETGYLTAGIDHFPDQSLGTVDEITLSMEKPVDNSNGLQASWNDQNNNALIDEGEMVYWAWNSSSHTNSLIPIYVNGSGAELFTYYISGEDPVRGSYLDNTDLFKVLDAVTLQPEVILRNYNYLPMIWKLAP